MVQNLMILTRERFSKAELYWMALGLKMKTMKSLCSTIRALPLPLCRLKACDQYGLFPDHTIEQVDAEAAYTQCVLKGTPTWVRLPEDSWPDEWFIRRNGIKTPLYKDPVCRLHKALYGHPDAGTDWEVQAE